MVLESLKRLKGPLIHMKDEKKVEDILARFIDGGAARLQVISDFDRTLTRSHLNGKTCDTCHGVIENSNLLPPVFCQRASELRDKYYPIEIDPNLTTDEKIPYIEEWYNGCHKLITECRVRQTDVDQMVKESDAVLRDKTDRFLDSLHAAGVPVLIFSAGIGDVLESILRYHGSLFPNIKVISNYMEFDRDGVVMGFKGKVIHTFNKNNDIIQSSPYFENLQERTNIVLLGDSLGDLQMSKGATSLSEVLKIGFLNEKIDTRLPEFLDNYDIVLTDDQTMDVVNDIILHIL